MNLGTLIGLILGIGLIGTAAFMSASETGVPLTELYDTISLLIVVGGSIAATAIALWHVPSHRRQLDLTVGTSIA